MLFSAYNSSIVSFIHLVHFTPPPTNIRVKLKKKIETKTQTYSLFHPNSSISLTRSGIRS